MLPPIIRNEESIKKKILESKYEVVLYNFEFCSVKWLEFGLGYKKINSQKEMRFRSV